MTPFAKLKLEQFPQPEVIMLRRPVLLCHGFGAIGNVGKKGLLHSTCMMLRSHGILAFAPNIAPYARISTRAAGWAEALDRLVEITGFDKIHVIAHSMGGLDMRYAISTLGRHTHIKSLTTVSTPHYGTSLAGLTLSTPEAIRDSLEGLTNWFGNNVYPEIPSDVIGALNELSPEYVEQTFNPENPDHPEVTYLSVTAACGKGTAAPINKMMVPFNKYIYEREGINDGYVATEKASWGREILRTSLSHPGQINLNLPSREKPKWEMLWMDIVKELVEVDA